MSARLFQTAHRPSASRQIATSIVFGGGASGTLNSSDAAFPSVAAGVWLPSLYLTEVLQLLRNWIFDAITGDPSIANAGTAAQIGLTGRFDLSDTPGESRCVIVLTTLNSTPATTLTSLTITNTSGWATPLGLCQDGASRTINASGGIITITGEFQPRGLWPFPDGFTDSGDEWAIYGGVTHQRADFGVDYFALAGESAQRDIVLTDLTAAQGGPPLGVALFSALSGDRKTITIKSTDETVTPSLSGALAGLGIVAAGDYVRPAGVEWCARVKTVGAASLELFEPVPSSVLLSSGHPIEVISEAHALRIEFRRAKLLAVHEQNDLSAVPLWGVLKCYTPRADGTAEERAERRSQDDPLYRCELALALNNKPGLSLP
jgi:hypothetical protein